MSELIQDAEHDVEIWSRRFEQDAEHDVEIWSRRHEQSKHLQETEDDHERC